MRTPALFALLLAVVFSGCTTLPPKDYALYSQHIPRSILILPPINNTVEVAAGYSVMTAASRPAAEKGYYVYPVVVVDEFMKANGVSDPYEMHHVPLEKLHAIFGSDAVLYMSVLKYGSKYQIVASNTFVHIHARLVDSTSGYTLWEGELRFEQAGQSGLIEAVVDQVMNKLIDRAHTAAVFATSILLTQPQQGLLSGPRRPEPAKM